MIPVPICLVGLELGVGTAGGGLGPGAAACVAAGWQLAEIQSTFGRSILYCDGGTNGCNESASGVKEIPLRLQTTNNESDVAGELGTHAHAALAGDSDCFAAPS
jgi:hypothetical protein